MQALVWMGICSHIWAHHWLPPNPDSSWARLVIIHQLCWWRVGPTTPAPNPYHSLLDKKNNLSWRLSLLRLVEMALLGTGQNGREPGQIYPQHGIVYIPTLPWLPGEMKPSQTSDHSNPFSSCLGAFIKNSLLTTFIKPDVTFYILIGVAHWLH